MKSAKHLICPVHGDQLSHTRYILPEDPRCCEPVNWIPDGIGFKGIPCKERLISVEAEVKE